MTTRVSLLDSSSLQQLAVESKVDALTSQQEVGVAADLIDAQELQVPTLEPAEPASYVSTSLKK